MTLYYISYLSVQDLLFHCDFLIDFCLKTNSFLKLGTKDKVQNRAKSFHMTYPLPLRVCVQGSARTERAERAFRGGTLYLGGHREMDVGNPSPAGPECGHGSLPTSPSTAGLGHPPAAQTAMQADGTVLAWSSLQLALPHGAGILGSKP